MKNVGIWLDKNKAHIITLNNSGKKIETINSNVENFHVHGGSGTRLKGGPQDVVQDSRYLERQKHQLKNYFDALATKIKNADAIAIFGPAETRIKFSKELNNNFKDIAAKIKIVKKTDSMTINQVVALIKTYFQTYLR